MIEAGRVARAGWPVVVDAVFDRVSSRAEIERIARSRRAVFRLLARCRSFGADRARRDAARRSLRCDARVLLAQMKGETGAIGWRRIDAARVRRGCAEIVARLVTPFSIHGEGSAHRVD